MSPCNASIAGQFLPAERKTLCRELIAADPLNNGIPRTNQRVVEPGIAATDPILLGPFFVSSE